MKTAIRLLLKCSLFVMAGNLGCKDNPNGPGMVAPDEQPSDVKMDGRKADDKLSFEELVPPLLAVVTKVDAGAGLVQIYTVKEDGASHYKGGGSPPRAVTVVQLDPKAELKVSQWRGTFTDTAGKVVSTADALKRLKVRDVVLVSGNGGKINPLYLNTFRAETLVLTLERRDVPKFPPIPGMVLPKDK